MRGMKRTAFLTVLLLGLCHGLTACAVPGRTQEYESSFFAMDTYMTFTVYDDDAQNAQNALAGAKDKIKALEALWSVTDPDSDIYAVNHGGGKPVAVQEETANLVSFALDMAEETGGALEPTLYPVLTAWGFTTGENRIPSTERLGRLLEDVGYDGVAVEENTVTTGENMMLDFGAVGKGYAGDAAIQILEERGIASALLNIGGNIQAIGGKPDGSDWRLGLRNPLGDGIFGTLRVSGGAVVTSGNYERYFIGEDGVRYGHIIDPKTGYPVDNELASVTVIAQEGKLCDALSTSLFVMGLPEAVGYWRTNRDRQAFDMILVTREREIWVTEEVKSRFDISADCEDWDLKLISTTEEEVSWQE